MTRGYVSPTWPNPNGPDDASIIIYGFVPSKEIPILAFILFGTALISHTYQAFRYRTWYFLPFTFGIAMEIAGYIPRYLSATKDPYNKIYFIVQYFFIVCTPVLLTAAIYACLYKMAVWVTKVRSSTKKAMGARPRWILWTFIAADIATTILQVAGAALIGKVESDHKDSTTANHILLAGLVVQAFSFITFLLVFFSFLGNLRRDPTFGRTFGGTRRFIYALIVASVLILLRIVFRLAETASGVFGYLMIHEAYYGVLEFAPVVVAVHILSVWHPGRWISVAPLAHDRNVSA
ncbi:RTA1-domain-containing protein [Stipitochalara longipes BDJ]|nr:RTA1-domain-containing protein [Stipitochalara longipes BDJ]